MINREKLKPVTARQEDVAFRISNSNIRVDYESRQVFVRDVLHRSNDEPWKSTGIEFGLLPSSAINRRSSRIVDNELLFDLYLRGIDIYANKLTEGKSFHSLIFRWSKIFIKVAEFAWVNGFFNLRDVPAQLWERFYLDIVSGGWTKVLAIEARAISILSANPIPAEDYLDRERNKKKISVHKSFLEILGTNIGGNDINVAKAIILQAADDKSLQNSGDIKRYKLGIRPVTSRSVVYQVLNALDVLAQVDLQKAIINLPGGSRHKFSMNKGRQGSRTTNMDPDTWAKLLVHAYWWIYDISPIVVRFVVALSKAQQKLIASGQGLIQTDHQNSGDRLDLLRELPERALLEKQTGYRITNYLKANCSGKERSVNLILTYLYAACFIVLVSMNGRRKDEIIGRAIGLHTSALKNVDKIFGIFECEFYMEKHINDYRPHYINDVTRMALEVLGQISNIAWLLADEPEKPTKGRERKLFLIPNFLATGDDFNKWFSFGNGTTRIAMSDFILTATGEQVRVTPHMFRRGYGLLYHYRYENAQLVALSQKYGHQDVTQALHYVSDTADTPHERTAIAKWSSPKKTLNSKAASFHLELLEIVQEVGDEKLRKYVSEVVDTARTFSGGFSKLVARFHRKLGGALRYGALDSSQQKKILADTLIARGHETNPYPWGNCMAGNSRKHSACSPGGGEIARENASPATCGRCAYSDTAQVHLESLKTDAKSLEGLITSHAGTLKERLFSEELVDLLKVISFHEARLGGAT
ncbi:hypothetical protein LJR066_000604 [Acidovorax sp. LjRoot66]|uniref:hypothetical protein n=1 Tax=Acidovorax sp. LjRoot66 TaxID=3342334 RepID=UPI003ED02816